MQRQSTEEHLQDIAELEEYATVTAGLQTGSHHQDHNYQNDVNEELQAVLDSPLPESLAEFSTYHSDMNSPKDVQLNSYDQGLQQSPMQQSPMRQYTSSPHQSIITPSPLQSPLIRHDSPGFAYPTPPGSHEEQSPGMTNTHLLPMLSPHNQSDNATQHMITRDYDEPPPQASSPLSAAFYIGKMSSAKAVQEALEEVLPGESINPEDSYATLSSLPPFQSPVQEEEPEQPPSTPSSQATITKIQAPNQVPQQTISIAPQLTLQQQMMPNSEDPLLSSSPKDFGVQHQQRKRFELGSFQSFKIVSTVGNNGLVDLSNPALTGILVDTNGELRFIQTTNPFSTKNIVVTSTGNLNAVTTQAQGPTTVQIIQQPIQAMQQGGIQQAQLIALPKREAQGVHKIVTGIQVSGAPTVVTNVGVQQQVQHSILHNKLTRISKQAQYTIPGKLNPTPRSKLPISIENIKQEETDDVFLSPTT